MDAYLNMYIYIIYIYNVHIYYCTFNIQTASVAASTECKPDIDEEWGIQWQLTSAGSVTEQQCPNGSGNTYIPNFTDK